MNQRVLLLCLCAIFAFSQIASAQHELEHTYHEHHSDCDIFIAFAANSGACNDLTVPEFYINSSEQIVIELDIFTPLQQGYLKPIRAPPHTPYYT